jgi:predicted deacetylase
VRGFVPPAWLRGEGAWRALRTFPFDYTTTMTHFHLLRPQQSLLAPSLVYTARNQAGRLLSPPAAGLMAAAMRPAPLVRLSLHPRDAQFPALLRHAQHLVERLLAERCPRTKAQFATLLVDAALTSTDPTSRRRPSASAQSRHTRGSDSHSA